MTAPARSGQDQLLAYAQDLAGAYELLQAQGELLPVPLDPKEPRRQAVRCGQVTVLVAGFPSLPAMLEEHANLESVLRTLNEHLAPVVEHVQACQGVVERFAGGTLTATFGARRELPGANELALAAAVAVIGANRRFNLQAGAGHRLEVGLGIAAGPAVAGRLGGPHRWELGVVGECVNIATQLAAKAQPYEILLGENVCLAVEHTIRAKYAGPTSLRGRRGNVATYSIKPVE